MESPVCLGKKLCHVHPHRFPRATAKVQNPDRMISANLIACPGHGVYTVAIRLCAQSGWSQKLLKLHLAFLRRLF